jgi:UDP-N-acetylmuramoyl-tripeptide--D-alanyl-D-alanine ligase
MINLSLSELTLAVDGTLLSARMDTGDQIINNIVTDSRALQYGEVFIALKGPNFDGHRFLKQVTGLGCSAAIVDHLSTEDGNESSQLKIPQIIVQDTRIALGKIAAYVKQKVAPKTVGITGSSGKTTVKEMVAEILSRLGNVLATKGNFNNDIGVPLTLLRLEQHHDFAVIEIGANHLGEIAYTANLVKPDVAIINNIAAAHLEGFGDLCGVARAKGEIFEGLSANGVAIYNQDCQYASKWQWRLVNKKTRRFSCHKSTEQSLGNIADIYSSTAKLSEDGCASFTLNTKKGSIDILLTIPGIHNVCNAVAAATIALEFGASLEDIRLGLEQMKPVKGRLNIYQLNNTVKLIDDTYNANVESVKAATDLLASYSGQRILILGDMGELGSVARSYHQEVGEHAQQKKLDYLFTLGVLSQSSSDAFNTNHQKKDKGQHFSSRVLLLTKLKAILNNEKQPVTILIKGSRSAHMEHVVEEVMGWQATDKKQTSLKSNCKNKNKNKNNNNGVKV